MLKRLWIKFKDWLNEETYRESWERQNTLIDQLRLQHTRDLKEKAKMQRKIDKYEERDI